MAEPYTIAIIGSGFSGTMLAIHLLGKKTDQQIRVVLIEKGAQFAKGVAYGTNCDLHLLNVPASSMSAFPSDPSNFFHWAKERDSNIEPTTFVQRKLYGLYLDFLLNEAQKNKTANLVFERMQDEAVGIELESGSKSVVINFKSSKKLLANRIALALGNFAPGNPPVEGNEFYKSQKYFQNPWSVKKTENPDQPVLLIGTGLTMIDKALELRSEGHTGTIYALSRHGLMPQIHKIGLSKLPPPFSTDKLPQTVRQLVRFLRDASKKCATKEAGYLNSDWRQVVDSIRPLTQEIWQKWPSNEQKRFNRHIRCYWDIHRHRIAPDVGSMIESMMRSRQLKVIAGRIVRYQKHDDMTDVVIHTRHTNEIITLQVSCVINCTGPQSNYERINDSLIASLRDQGIVNPDPHRLGMNVSENYALKDKSGHPSKVFFTLGPPLKGLLWESVAVPELRVQAVKLTNELASNWNWTDQSNTSTSTTLLSRE